MFAPKGYIPIAELYEFLCAIEEEYLYAHGVKYMRASDLLDLDDMPSDEKEAYLQLYWMRNCDSERWFENIRGYYFRAWMAARLAMLFRVYACSTDGTVLRLSKPALAHKDLFGSYTWDELQLRLRYDLSEEDVSFMMYAKGHQLEFQYIDFVTGEISVPEYGGGAFRPIHILKPEQEEILKKLNGWVACLDDAELPDDASDLLRHLGYSGPLVSDGEPKASAATIADETQAYNRARKLLLNDTRQEIRASALFKMLGEPVGPRPWQRVLDRLRQEFPHISNAGAPKRR